MIQPTKIEAVRELYSQDSFNSCDENGLVDWKDGHTTTNAEVKAIDDKYKKLLAEFNAQAYSRKREAEYPSLQECVHAILDDTLDALQAKRAEIKTKYPKGG